MYISATLQGVSGPSLDKKIRDLLYDVGLSEKVDKQTKTLSGGQKRKLSVAMSLVGDAKVVFLDEPTRYGLGNILDCVVVWILTVVV